MSVKKYNISKSGTLKISKNFKVKEFQCHDGTDEVFIDDDLVYKLQKIREHFGVPVNITSAYRTPEYNAKIGGSKTSFHVKGQACDIQVKGINPVIVGMFAESIGMGGIGVYAYVQGFTHVDTRSTKYRWLQLSKVGGYEAISKIMPTIKKGGVNNTYNSVRLLQSKLGISQSGTFGDITEKAVKLFQAKNNLLMDGKVGNKTWTKLFS